MLLLNAEQSNQAGTVELLFLITELPPNLVMNIINLIRLKVFKQRCLVSPAFLWTFLCFELLVDLILMK